MFKIFFLSTFFVIHSTFAASTFNEVKDIVFKNVYENEQLPQYEVSTKNFVVNGLNRLLDRATRTLNETNDYYPKIDKLVHANGICFSGVWTITKNNPYSGLFKRGSQALIIARASAATSSTRSDESRSLGFAGKIFPTMDPNQSVETANFFVIDNLMGKMTEHYLETTMTNKPELGFKLGSIGFALKVFNIFKDLDKDPGYRPVYPIAEAGLLANERVSTPKFFMIKADSRVLKNEESDFRDELSINKNHPNGVVFNILVNDTTSDLNSNEWNKIGQISLNESIVSYGCDKQLHFHHPKIK
jgi:hypothetical protein